MSHFYNKFHSKTALCVSIMTAQGGFSAFFERSLVFAANL